MHELLQSLQDFLLAGGRVIVELGTLLLPWTPLAAWIVFWLFAVNWQKLRPVLLEGGWIGLLLIGLVMVLVWGVVAPPESGAHYILGLTLSNFVGKTVYVTALFSILLICGSLQLAGCCANCFGFEEAEPVELDTHVEHAHHH
jgi:hypothetical protein